MISLNLIQALFLTLTLTTISLHIPNSHALQKRYDESKYLDVLEQKQQRFQSDLKTLSQQIEQVNKQFASVNTTESVMLSKVQQGIAEERDSLYKIEAYLNLPFNLRACTCKNFTKEKRRQLEQTLASLQDYISKLKSEVKDCAQCPLIVQIKRQISKEQNYIKVMQDGLSAQCCRQPKQLLPQNATGLVDVNQSLYKDNLDAAKNWHYGNLTIDQYYYRTFQITTKYNLTSCPAQNPYALSEFRGCTFCPATKQFNLGTRQCDECGNFQVFDVYTKKCIKVSCQPHQQFSMKTRKCQPCPQQKPIFNEMSLKCQPCPPHQAFNKTAKACKRVDCLKTQFFNQTIKACQNCPDSAPLYDQKQQKCYQCPTNQALNKKSLRCEMVTCRANQWFNQTLKKCVTCPDLKPVYNKSTQKCQACPPLQIFNLTANKCQTFNCPKNQIYNVTAGQCQNCPKSHPILNSNTKQCEACPLGSGFDPSTKQCFQCPSDTPQWNSITYECQECPETAIWNNDEKLCMKVTCPQKFPNFNPESKKCEVCPNSYVFDDLIKKCRLKDTTGICPPNKPIYDSSSYSCRPCPNNSTYNKLKGQCQHNCKKGEYFNWQTGQCISVCDAPLLYHNGTCMTQQEIKGCSSKDMFFDRTLNKCLPISQTCDPDTQYYNTKTHTCMSVPFCPFGYSFNQTAQKCQIINYATSPNTTNLIYSKPFEQYMKQYEKMKAEDPGMKDCPTQHPFYNKDIKKCVSCPESHPYFNLSNNKCQDCGGLEYDPKLRSCHTEDVNVGPTLERLIMNIV